MLSPRQPRQQSGFVMIIALVALTIMTLAAIGLVRTVSTSASIAGNLAMEHAAASSADQAVEAAVAWLENNSGQVSSSSAATCPSASSVLACDQKARGYVALRADPAGQQTWSQLWSQLTTAGYAAVPFATDVAGNTAAYLIQRMCTTAGDPATSGCSASPMSLDTSSSRKAGSAASASSSQVYYRITVQVSGPRNTVSFTQAMVAL